MNTEQSYVGKGDSANTPPQSVQNEARNSSMPDDRQPTAAQQFVIHNTDLIGLAPNELEPLLTSRLLDQPIHYTTVLDGLALLRALTPRPETFDDCHYALLIDQQGSFTRLACLNREVEANDSADYLPANQLDVAQLEKILEEPSASGVLLASTRVTVHDTFSPADLSFADQLYDSLEVKGIEMLDWLIMTPNGNTSWFWQLQPNDDSSIASAEGVNWDTLMNYGTNW